MKTVKTGNLIIGQGRPALCASVAEKSEESILNAVGLVNSSACDLFELRIDHFDKAEDICAVTALLEKVREKAQKPMIFTFRRKCEGGERMAETCFYRSLIKEAAGRALADIIDIEASSLDGDSTFVKEIKDTGCAVIVSKHDFSKTPSKEEITAVFKEMAGLEGDIIKAAYMPNSRQDVMNLMQACLEVEQQICCPVIAVSMGASGIISRIMGEFFKSAVTFASLTRASAPGQIDVQELSGVLDLIHENMVKA